MNKRTTWMIFLALAAVFAAGATSLASILGTDGFLMRGGGASRDALDAMQLKTFDQSLWSNLSSWSGPAVTPDQTKGKVVLVVVWASWHRSSFPAVRSAEALYKKYADKGLVVIGVHNPRGFEYAKKKADELGVTFLYAADKDGKFRAGIKADADPNLYLIDRAGNMRYAQIELSSLDSAVAKLVAETPEQAVAIPEQIAAKRAQLERDQWRTVDASEIAASGNVKFTQPGEEAYKNVAWPYGTADVDPILGKITDRSPHITLSDDHWVPAKPKTDGKLMVIYLLDPADQGMCGVVPVMNDLAQVYKDDVVVIGAAMKLGEPEFNVTGDKKGKLTERNEKVIKTFLEGHVINHSINAAPIDFKYVQQQQPTFSTMANNQGVCMVASTDGRVRWIGNPYNSVLHRVIDQLIAADPGVQARRAAERK